MDKTTRGEASGIFTLFRKHLSGGMMAYVTTAAQQHWTGPTLCHYTIRTLSMAVYQAANS